MDGRAGELCTHAFHLASRDARPASGVRVPRSEPRRHKAALEANASAFDAHTDDRVLVDAAVAGDRAAFDLIVERYRRTVYQVCYRFVGHHEDASDLTQDAFIRAYRALAKFKGDAALGTWLYRIAVNVCLNRLALKTPPHEALETEQIEETRGDRPDEPVMRAERAALVKAAIARLPKKQRATVILRVYHDLPHDQIAHVLGSSVGAVKANFFHALQNLKRLLSGGPLS
jgi:RNA polymerase sigma-70 factor, ECF subfamily